MAAWARDLAADVWPAQGPAVRVFVAGAASHAGKSTVCLGLLSAAVERFGAAQVAYIKAATQDERPDSVSRWCEKVGVACVSGSACPIVYYAGFTRAFLDGAAGTSADWLDGAERAVAARASPPRRSEESIVSLRLRRML